MLKFMFVLLFIIFIIIGTASELSESRGEELYEEESCILFFPPSRFRVGDDGVSSSFFFSLAHSM